MLVRTAIPAAELHMLLLSPSRPGSRTHCLLRVSWQPQLPVICSFIFIALISASEYLVQILMACLFAAMIPENTAGAP